jgi:hypothetical protein
MTPNPLHLCTASDCTAETLIGFATCFLFHPLGGPCLPIVSNRFGCVIGQIPKNFVLVHGAILSGSYFVFQKANAKISEEPVRMTFIFYCNPIAWFAFASPSC